MREATQTQSCNNNFLTRPLFTNLLGSFVRIRTITKEICSSTFHLRKKIFLFSLASVLAVALPHSRRFFSANKTYDLTGAIAEMNKEMELIFGDCPPIDLAGSISKNHLAEEPELKPHELASSSSENFNRSQESQFPSRKMNQNPVELTHIGSAGEAQMVDVSPKGNTKRTAIASCRVMLGKKVFDMVLANQMAKGDVLTVAKIAGINGAKHTSSLIPLCHNIILSHVRVDLLLNPDDHSVKIEAEAASTGKTGVEMEAMTAATVAGLTVYDMCKAASKEILMTDVRLERKIGGKSGDWCREE